MTQVCGYTGNKGYGGYASAGSALFSLGQGRDGIASATRIIAAIPPIVAGAHVFLNCAYVIETKSLTLPAHGSVQVIVEMSARDCMPKDLTPIGKK